MPQRSWDTDLRAGVMPRCCWLVPLKRRETEASSCHQDRTRCHCWNSNDRSSGQTRSGKSGLLLSPLLFPVGPSGGTSRGQRCPWQRPSTSRPELRTGNWFAGERGKRLERSLHRQELPALIFGIIHQKTESSCQELAKHRHTKRSFTGNMCRLRSVQISVAFRCPL